MHSSSLMQEPNQINGWFQSFPSQFTCVHAIFGCKGNICEQEQPWLVESRSSWREAQMWVSLPCTSKDKPVPPVLMRFRIHLLASWNDLKLPSSCFHVCFFPKWESDNTQYPCCSKKWLTCQAFSHGIFPERVGKVCQWKILGSFVMSFVFVVNKKKVSVQRSARICLGASRRKQDYFVCKMQWLTHIYAYIFIYTYMYVCTNANTQKKVSDLFKRKKGVTGKTP